MHISIAHTEKGIRENDMKKVTNKFYDKSNRIATYIVLVTITILLGLLVYYSTLYSSYIAVTYYEVVLVKKDSLIWNLVVALAGILVMVGVARIFSKNRKSGVHILLALVLLWSFIFSIIWVSISNSLPCADQEMVFTCAKQFAEGNYDSILQNNSGYLYLYPHQIGLVAYYEILIKVFHWVNPEIVQYGNIVWLLVIIVVGYKITEMLFKNSKTTIYYLLIIAFCLPLLFYTPFVYGEMISLAFVFLQVLMVLKYFTNRIFSYAFLGVLFTFLSIAVRMNTIIVTIACVITCIFMAIIHKKAKDIILAAVMLVIALTTISMIQFGYEKKSGYEFGEGVPKLAHIAMGLQECVSSPGWSNSFNKTTYIDSGYNTEETNRISKESISTSMDKFKGDSTYAKWFFKTKFVSQWNEPTYECFQMNSYHEEELGELATSVYYEKWNTFFWAFMNRYQFAVYGLALLFVLSQFKNPGNMSRYILLIAIIGGVIFHMIWEAKGRYTLPYMIMMLPYAAAGVSFIENMGAKIYEKTFIRN